jgi:hypothetical protein
LFYIFQLHYYGFCNEIFILIIIFFQLVEQNSSLKKEVAIAERKLLARNERIQALEALLQDAQEKLTTQNQK